MPRQPHHTQQQRQCHGLWLLALLLLPPPPAAHGSSGVTVAAAAATAPLPEPAAGPQQQLLQYDVWGFPASPGSAAAAHRVAGAYASVLNSHAHNLSASQRSRGLANVGHAPRLRRLLAKLEAGQDVSVGVIGGSISWGFYMQRGVTDWFALFSAWLQQAFPAARVRRKNGCVPATTAEYVSICLEHFVDVANVDLVFMEYAINDGYTDTSVDTQHARAFERLVRKLLVLPQSPAVVLVQVLAQAVRPNRGPFYWTVEDHYAVLAQYYGLPWLSQRDAMYHEVLRDAPGFRVADIYPPVEQQMQRHPNELGHKYLADLAVSLVQRVFRDALLEGGAGGGRPPGGDSDEAAWHRRLLQVPPPMFARNYESKNLACLIGEAFPRAVNASAEWAWANDGSADKPKWGFSTRTPGAVLDISVDTRAAAAHDDSSSNAAAAAAAAAAAGTSSELLNRRRRRQQRLLLAAASAGDAAASAPPASAPPAADDSAGAAAPLQLRDAADAERQQQRDSQLHDDAWWQAQQAVADEQARSKQEEASLGPRHGSMIVWVGYTKTWRGGGRAQLSCHGGCACDSIIVDAHHRWKTTQSYMAKVFTHEAQHCIVRVTVLSESSSDGHFFKIAGVMVTRRVSDYDNSDHTDVLLLNAMQGDEYKLQNGKK